MREDLQSKAGGANIVWKEGIDTEVRDECEEARIVYELDDAFNYGLTQDKFWFHFLGECLRKSHGRETFGK